MTVILMLFTFTPSITNAQESDNDFTQEELDQAIKTLKAIEEIPDELLESGRF